MTREIIDFSKYKDARKTFVDTDEDILATLNEACREAEFDEEVIKLVSLEGTHLAYVKPDSDFDQLQGTVQRRLIASRLIGRKALHAKKPLGSRGPIYLFSTKGRWF